MHIYSIHLLSFSVNCYTKLPRGLVAPVLDSAGQSGQGHARAHTVASTVPDCASCSCYKHHGFSQVASRVPCLALQKLASHTYKGLIQVPLCRIVDALWASTCEETRQQGRFTPSVTRALKLLKRLTKYL